LEILLRNRGLSVRRLSIIAEIPYTTTLELATGKKAVEKAASGTIYKISRVLGVSMEELVEAALLEAEKNGDTKNNANEQL